MKIAMTNELHHVKQALAEASNEVISLKKQYATALRKLDKLKTSPASRAAEIVKAVLKCFLPECDVDNIQLSESDKMN